MTENWINDYSDMRTTYRIGKSKVSKDICQLCGQRLERCFEKFEPMWSDSLREKEIEKAA